MAKAKSAKRTLFICYSHTDRSYREEFTKFLATAALNDIQIFSDAEIAPGDDWQQTIVQQLEQATAALILVSQDFMISPFIQQVELRELLASYIRRGLRLFLVPVRSTNYQGTYLSKFEWARPPDQPLSLLTPELRDKAMVDICVKITDLLAGPERDPSLAERTIECLESVPTLDLPSSYSLEEPVGEGEFARCFKATDRLLGSTVIVKVLNTPLAQESPGYDKYVRSAGQLTHRNILGLLFSQANKLPHFIVTPAIGDDTLERRLATGSIALGDAVTWTTALADALAYAHGKDCVHGRIRSCEVRFDRDNQPVLSAFRTRQSLTAAPPDPYCRMSLGEFLDASPEQRVNGQMTPKTDQYQLGLLAYHMIAGARPVTPDESGWASILKPEVAHRLIYPEPLIEVAPSCPDRLSDIVMRMLSRDPGDRWPSLGHVLDALRALRVAAPPVEQAKASYRRCAQHDAFYETLYNRLFARPEIAAMFAGRSMPQQYQMLRDALWLLLSYDSADAQSEPTVLSGIARTHSRFDPALFDAFGQAVLDAVAQHDPSGDTAVAAWRAAIAPGLGYLKSRAGRPAAIGAQAATAAGA